MSDIDMVVHQPMRLRIMASLVMLEAEEQVDFTYLRELLKATDGNLGAHLQKLEEAKYIGIQKTFVRRKPRTFISATGRGRAAFTEHVGALKEITKGVGKNK